MNRPELSPRQRVFAAFKGEAYDRMPLINPTSIANLDCMRLAKTHFPYAHYHAAQMAALACTGRDILKYDSVMPYFGVCNEAAALGCDINWGSQDILPRVRTGVLSRLDQYAPPANYLDKKHIRVVLDAIRGLKQKYKKEVAIIGKVICPLSLGFQLYGIQNMLTSLVLEPDLVKAFIGQLTPLVIDFARAQIEAGADIITLSDDASGDPITRDCYRHVAMEANNAIHRALSPDALTIYHMSGIITDKIQLFASGGFDGFSFDSQNDIPALKNIIGNRIKLIGSINNPTTLLNGTAEEIRKEVLLCIKRGVHLLAPECATPCRVPNASHLAMQEAIRQYYGNFYTRERPEVL